MSYLNANSKRKVESILVAKSNAAVLGAGTALATASGGTNLADGQIGVFDYAGEGTNTSDTAIAPGDTVTNSPIIRIAQGTGKVAGTKRSGGWYEKPYLATGPIIGNNVTVWKGDAYIAPALEAWAFGAAVGASDAINLADGNEYQVRLSFRGRRVEELNSMHGYPSLNINFTADFDSISASTDAAKTDYIVQNLVKQINYHSKAYPSRRAGNVPVVAFAVSTTSAGAGTAISAISAGTVFDGITFDQPMVDALAAIVSDTNNDIAATADLLVPIDLDTAGDGSTSTADTFIVIGLQNDVASQDNNDDRIPQVGVRIDAALKGDFSSNVGAYNSADMVEGTTSRAWDIRWRVFNQRLTGQNRILIPLDTVDSPIVDGAQYDAYVIEHQSTSQLGVAQVSVSPKREIILVPTGDTVTKAALEAVLNPYFASTGFTNVSL